jgi:hypothetical protein
VVPSPHVCGIVDPARAKFGLKPLEQGELSSPSCCCVRVFIYLFIYLKYMYNEYMYVVVEGGREGGIVIIIFSSAGGPKTYSNYSNNNIHTHTLMINC